MVPTVDCNRANEKRNIHTQQPQRMNKSNLYCMCFFSLSALSLSLSLVLSVCLCIHFLATKINTIVLQFLVMESFFSWFAPVSFRSFLYYRIRKRIVYCSPPAFYWPLDVAPYQIWYKPKRVRARKREETWRHWYYWLDLRKKIE